MSSRLQFCQICQKRTKHKYKGVSVIAFLVLFVLFFPLALIYLYIALKRADRSAYCTVNHAAQGAANDEKRLRELIAAVQAANAQHDPRRSSGV